MRVTKRICDVRRHTVGYVIAGKKYTRGQAVKLARRSKIENVVAYKRDDGWHIASYPNSGINLYDLPVVVAKKTSKK